MTCVLVWVRNCYRLSDSPILHAAQQTGLPVIPVVIISQEESGEWATGSASQWWLHHSLQHFQQKLEAMGSRLILKTGHPVQVLTALVQCCGARALIYNYRYEPHAMAMENAVENALSAQCSIQAFHTNVLSAPRELLNRQNKPYQVFTPYWKALQQEVMIDKPLPEITTLKSPGHWPDSLALEELSLLPSLNWADRFPEYWTAGEESALTQLETFTQNTINNYDHQRDIPGVKGTSRLSTHLHFGEISPRQIWHEALNNNALPSASSKNVYRYLSELAWRDFAHQLLVHFPETPKKPLREQFINFPWQLNEAEHLKYWQQGKTGYPIVDAGMRELWQTGWMHNRVRMIVASFLVKHLLLPWQWGAEWFWDTLLDADLASNTLGWQWAAGCGADAAPYFRIFNPILQGKKFDPHGNYVRQWVPELKQLPDTMIHTPWLAAPLELLSAGITLGETYPFPVVDHVEARARALKALASLKTQHSNAEDINFILCF